MMPKTQGNMQLDIEVKINVIEYNKIDLQPFTNLQIDTRTRFIDYLNKHKCTNVQCAKAEEKDIDAACGQLANKIKLKHTYIGFCL